MLNQVIIAGRLTREPEVRESENGKRYSNVTVAVPRSYKNADGVYETDFVDCVLWDGVASTTAEYCHKGDVIGVKGRIQTSDYETEEGEKKKSTQIIAEKITFLSSKSKDIEDEKNNSDDMEM